MSDTTLELESVILQYQRAETKLGGAVTTISKKVDTLRHTFATLLISAGSDLYTVSELLGHTSIKTTQIYADVLSETKLDAVNRVTSIFG